jgi:hypothetical protein
MAKEYHKFYVPRDLWHEIASQAEETLGMTTTELAKSYLIAGVYGKTPSTGRKEKISTTKTNINKRKKYRRIYVSNGTDGHWVYEKDDKAAFFSCVREHMMSGIRTWQNEMMQHHLNTVVIYENDETFDDDILIPAAEGAFVIVQEFRDIMESPAGSHKVNTPDIDAFSDLYDVPILKGEVIK